MNVIDPSAAFTSEFVTDNLARKTFRFCEEASTANAHQFSKLLLQPIAERLASRGRMPRGALGKLCDKLVQNLREETGVVHVEYKTVERSKLSAREDHHISYLMTTGSSDEHWLQFLANEACISRKLLQATHSVVDFRVHRHAVARYMQRELKPADEMFRGIAETVHASAIIAASAFKHTNSEHLAIPLKRGLLLGRGVTIPDRAVRTTLSFDRRDCKTEKEKREGLLDVRRGVQMMTYLDERSMSPQRSELYDAIRAFIDDHQFALKTAFNASYHVYTVLQDDEIDTTMPLIHKAVASADELVKSKVWQTFTETVQ